MAAAVSACGGGSDGGDVADGDADDVAEASPDDVADTDPTDTGADEAATDTGSDTGTERDSGAETATDDESSDAGSSGTYEPGEAEFRAVNALDRPVDIYVRTTGLVEAFPIQSDLAPGAVSDFVAPPEGGSYVVTEAGAGDATCVTTCDHFIGVLSASFPENGDTYTVVLHDDPFSDRSRAMDLWEAPEPGQTSSNAMPTPDPDSALAVVTAVGVTDADFGLRLAVGGSDGCLAPLGGGNLLIGGNQTPAFAIGDATAITLHDQPDQDCSAEPVGGPFEVSGDPGSRLHVVLTGSPGELEAIVLPMVDAEIDTAAATDDAEDPDEPATSGGSDRDAAVALMEVELASEFGLEGDGATCTAELIVDALGADVIVVDNELVELETLGADAQQATGEALVASVDQCGVDPAVYGG